ncbi:MAG TPA: YceI family protein [Chitinophagaceae bacterium]|nr:YceI family protein [Chitinophagaceae bacterium]
MKKIFIPAVALLAIVTGITAFRPAAPVADAATTASFGTTATKWLLDKGHSNVKFSVTHMVVAETEGYFRLFDGTMENTKPDYSDAKIVFTVDVNSINTDNERRDNHLKSDDFFNAEKFPQMKFESTSFQPVGGNKYKLNGNLTIRDVTKPVTFDVTYGGELKTSRGTTIGFKALGTINRFDYGLKWDRATETGGLVVGKDVEIIVKLELRQAPPGQ